MESGVPSQVPSPAMEVRIWGARGSVPTPKAENLRVGGNTSCIDVMASTGERVIFDAGTGIRNLGLAELQHADKQHDLHIFLTHFHWDHLQGLPFFTPLYSPDNIITFHSACPSEHLRHVLSGQMTNPYFPVRFDLVAAALNFEQIYGKAFRVGEMEIASFALHHPGGACGYTIDTGGGRVVYGTDHEHGNAEADARLLAMSQGADVLIYDSQFTPEEYPSHVGWGHSTWLEATRVAAAAGVKQLVLFHHDPGHTDDEMFAILEKARREFPNTSLAIEGMAIPVMARV
jgi:phosphoribosyl 1,2-cyclic phosphodiesterase